MKERCFSRIVNFYKTLQKREIKKPRKNQKLFVRFFVDDFLLKLTKYSSVFEEKLEIIVDFIPSSIYSHAIGILFVFYQLFINRAFILFMLELIIYSKSFSGFVLGKLFNISKDLKIMEKVELNFSKGFW